LVENKEPEEKKDFNGFPLQGDDTCIRKTAENILRRE